MQSRTFTSALPVVALVALGAAACQEPSATSGGQARALDPVARPAARDRPARAGIETSGRPALVRTGSGPVTGWLRWRGPGQDGTSAETGLPEDCSVHGPQHQWSYPVAGRGTPVIAGDRVYAIGYEGGGAELQEILLCLDQASGRRLAEFRVNDFLSDVIYSRYGIGSPAIDPESGRVHFLSTSGLLTCLSPDLEPIWQRSLMEDLGRLTFPNGRTGAPIIDGDRVIAHVISSGWGALAPARDRFYAFDKRSGELIWISTPGEGPKDSSFSHPVLGWQNGRRVLFAGTGCGNLVCVDARTGEPVWRYKMSVGGVNSSPLRYGDSIIAIHGRENVDSSIIGRMVSVRLDEEPGPAAGGGAPVLSPGAERWRNDLCMFTSSPVLVNDRVYQTVQTGDLCCVDAETGGVLWSHKLAPDQIHASPVWGDGKLYVPMNNGSFWIVRPTDAGPEVIQEVQLAGSCLGAPAICNGRVYVHTTERLYCWGGDGQAPPWPADEVVRSDGDAARLQVIPAEVLIQPGEQLPLRGVLLNDKGQRVAATDGMTWAGAPGPSLELGPDVIVAGPNAPVAGHVLQVASAGVSGEMRVRVVPRLPFAEDFEGYELTIPRPDEPGVKVAFPPSSWLGGRPKWVVRDLEGERVLARALDNPLFQRTMTFFGHPAASDYTMVVDVRSDGNRRMMSSGGVIHQRYMIGLMGNHQRLEISSNHERIKEFVDFQWRPGVWYRLKTSVEAGADGAAIVRAKAWPRDEAEPAGWTISFTHRNGHPEGAPGLFGFTPQSRFAVYLDNLKITPN